MKYFVIILIFLGGLNHLFAQEKANEISLLISSRVDTTSVDVKSIIRLYENYFKSNPDSIYDNPFWNNKEKELYKDFDFSRESIFQGGMSANSLFKYFSPFVMSVEPIGEKYQIRVLFSSPTTNPQYAGSKVWCIQKLNAIKEDGNWVFENLIVEISKNWSSKKMGFIEYIYPPNHQFDVEEAKLGQKFCTEIIQRFNPNFNGSLNYYVSSSIDDMGLLENFDYYFVGITTGKARESMILSAKGNEHYPHEFVHKLLPQNPNRGHVIEEGLATFLGTKEDQKEFSSIMSKLATDVKENSEKYNFKSVVSQSEMFNGYQTAYPAGAAICELIYNQLGDEGLIQLMHAKTEGFTEIIESACSITNLSEQELETKWNETVTKYYQRK